MASHPYVVCDVFTDRPLQGNQLAVFPDAPAIDDGQLQQLAREMNFSETVFVYPAAADADARVRILTPTTELPFAGHPILGTAFVLDPAPARPSVEPFANTSTLFAALRVDRSRLPVEVYDNGVRHLYVCLESEQIVAGLKPDLAALASLLPHVGVNGFAGKGSRWKTRMFAHGDGVVEDPATGSAAGPLAVHLARHGLIEFGAEIQISQGAELRRPSTLFARVDGTPDRIEQVQVGRAVVIVARGEFSL